MAREELFGLCCKAQRWSELSVVAYNAYMGHGKRLAAQHIPVIASDKSGHQSRHALH